MEVIVRNLNGMFRERMKLGLTLKDVATAARVSERAIRKYEEGTSYPTNQFITDWPTYLCGRYCHE